MYNYKLLGNSSVNTEEQEIRHSEELIRTASTGIYRVAVAVDLYISVLALPVTSLAGTEVLCGIEAIDLIFILLSFARLWLGLWKA